MSTNHRPSYVALVAALRAEFNDMQLEVLRIKMRPYRYETNSISTLFQAVHDAGDVNYDAVGEVDPEETIGELHDRLPTDVWVELPEYGMRARRWPGGEPR